jgi:hypothetical protein
MHHLLQILCQRDDRYGHLDMREAGLSIGRMDDQRVASVNDEGREVGRRNCGRPQSARDGAHAVAFVAHRRPSARATLASHQRAGCGSAGRDAAREGRNGGSQWSASLHFMPGLEYGRRPHRCLQSGKKSFPGGRKL